LIWHFGSTDKASRYSRSVLIGETRARYANIRLPRATYNKRKLAWKILWQRADLNGTVTSRARKLHRSRNFWMSFNTTNMAASSARYFSQLDAHTCGEPRTDRLTPRTLLLIACLLGRRPGAGAERSHPCPGAAQFAGADRHPRRPVPQDRGAEFTHDDVAAPDLP